MYLTLKFLHVASTIVFLGNIATGLYWKRVADRGGDHRAMVRTLEALARSERLFTLPAAAVLIASGLWLAKLAALPILGTPWLARSLLLFAASGLSFGLFVAPLQRKLVAVLATNSSGVPAQYHRLSLRWELSGALSIVASIAALGLMVFRP